jgi:hypothetical protein
LKLVNDIVSNAKPLCLVEFMPQPANQLASTPQCEGHSKPEHVPTRHCPNKERYRDS